jgi:hypothetical protein
MATNVKPGDMAMIIRAYDNYQWTLGRPVKIKDGCCRSTPELVIWTFEEPLRGPDGSFARCAYDRCLKRIDPLADDADDGVKVGIFDEIPSEGPVTTTLTEELV